MSPEARSPAAVARSSAARAPGALLLVVTYIGFISLGLPDGLLPVAWPSVQAALARAQTDLGVLLLVYGAAYFVAGFIAHRLIQRFRLSSVLTATSLLVAAGLTAFAFAPHWPQLVAATLAMGLGAGIINTAINARAAAAFTATHVNWLHACYSLGAALGPLLLAAVMAHGVGWRAGYWFAAFVPAVMAAIYFVTRAQWSAPVKPEADVAQSPAGMRDVLGHELIRVQITAIVCYSAVEQILGRWYYTLATEHRGIDPKVAAIGTSLYFGSIFVGRAVLGALIAHVGADRMVRIATVGALLGTLCFASAPSTLGTVGLVIAGLCLGPIFPTLIYQTAGRVPASLRVAAVGVSVSAAILGSATAPYLAGLLAQQGGPGVIGWLAVLAGVGLFVLNERLARGSLPQAAR